MRFQQNKASCGPAALHNGLAALGIHRSEDELITLCGQKTDGTSSAQLMRALKAIPDTHPEAVKYRSEHDAIVGLWWALAEKGRPLVLCVDDFEHWVVAIGYLGYRFAVADSADNRLVLYYSGASLCTRWLGPSGGYHGIII